MNHQVDRAAFTCSLIAIAACSSGSYTVGQEIAATGPAHIDPTTADASLPAPALDRHPHQPTPPAASTAADGGTPNFITSLSAGVDVTCAVTAGGAVECWGANPDGVGVAVAQSAAPTGVLGLSSGVASVTGTCAIMTSGGVTCWDNGGSAPAPLPNLPAGGVTALTLGNRFSCALTSTGVICWGSNNKGQLGNGTYNDSTVPVNVWGLSSGVTAVAAGNDHACALTSAGAVMCWGSNEVNQLGDGSEPSLDSGANTWSSVPVAVAGLSSGVVAIASGGRTSCALTSAGAVLCWGYMVNGSYETGSTVSGATPVVIQGWSSGMAAIAVGDAGDSADYACAATTGGAPSCWGDNLNGQLGNGGGGDIGNIGVSVPGPVLNLSSGVKSFALGGDHTCALMKDGTVQCWGVNDVGQLGNTTVSGSNVPVPVLGL